MKKHILVASHYTKAEGLTQKWIYYLKRNKYQVTSLLHPLYPREQLPSKLESEGKIITMKIPAIMQFVFEGIVSLYMLQKTGGIRKFEAVICFDPLSFFHIYLLRRFFGVRQMIFYSVDFSKIRYNNSLLNGIYQRINMFAYKKSDYFLSITEQLIREIDPDNKLKDKENIFIVRHTVDLQNRNTKNKKLSNSVFFVGTLYDSVYFDDLIKALARLKKEKIPFQFDICGHGSRLSYIRELVKHHNLSKEIKFIGIVSYEKLITEILPKYMIGLSPYIIQNEDKKQDFILNVEDLTTKMVDYISFGMPIICSRTSRHLETIRKNKFGFVVKNEDEWYNTLVLLLTNKKLYNEYSENALRFAKRYDEEHVLTPILNKVLQNR